MMREWFQEVFTLRWPQNLTQSPSRFPVTGLVGGICWRLKPTTGSLYWVVFPVSTSRLPRE
jgi:hypothetical protein